MKLRSHHQVSHLSVFLRNDKNLRRNASMPKCFSCLGFILGTFLYFFPSPISAQQSERKVDSLMQVIATLNENNEQLIADLENYRSLTQSEIKKNEKLRSLQKNMQIELDVGKKESQEARELIQTQEKQIKFLNEKINKIRFLEEENNELSEKNKITNSLKSELNGLKKEKLDLIHALEAKSASLEKANTINSRLEAEIIRLNTIEKENQTLKEDLRTTRDHLIKTNDELESIYQKLEEKSKSSAQAKELQKLKLELKKIINEFDTYKKNTEKFRAYLIQEINILDQEVINLFQAQKLLGDESQIEALNQRIELFMLFADEQLHMPADSQKINQIHRINNRLKAYNALWLAIQEAEKTLSRKLKPDDMYTIYNDLKKVNMTGFCIELQNLKQEKLTMLESYCATYRRMYDFFESFNDLDSSDLITKNLNRLKTGPSAIDPTYRYIHEQIDKRMETPLQESQPFFNFSNCPPFNR